MVRVERVLTPQELAKRAQRREVGDRMVLDEDVLGILRVNSLRAINDSVDVIKAIKGGDTRRTTVTTHKPEIELRTNYPVDPPRSLIRKDQRRASRIIQRRRLRDSIDRELAKDKPRERKLERQLRAGSELLEALRSERIN